MFDSHLVVAEAPQLPEHRWVSPARTTLQTPHLAAHDLGDGGGSQLQQLVGLQGAHNVGPMPRLSTQPNSRPTDLQIPPALQLNR